MQNFNYQGEVLAKDMFSNNITFYTSHDIAVLSNQELAQDTDYHM